jgi:HK97 family phage major capsid protein
LPPRPGDILFDLIAAFKKGYLNNAVWATKREVIAKIRKFKEATTNAYMWQPGLQTGPAGQVARLSHHQVGGYAGAFHQRPVAGAGRLQDGLSDRGSPGLPVLRDPYTNKPYVRFYTTRRVGGQVVQFEAI